MNDQPLFEVDDTTSTYSPPRATRPRWAEGGRTEAPAQVAATQHWFDPDAARPRPTTGTQEVAGAQSVPRQVGARGQAEGRTRLLAGGVAVAVVSAAIASAATVGLLVAGGWLDGPTGMHGGAPGGASPLPQLTLQVDRPDTSRIAAEVSPAVVTVLVGAGARDALAQQSPLATVSGIASGVVFHEAGWIITNRHVVCDTGTIVVLLPDGRRLVAQLYGLDTLTDLAVIRVDATGLTAADIGDSDSLRTGQLSMVIGSSAQSPTRVTSGVISALGQDLMVGDPCLDGARRVLRNVIRTDVEVSQISAGGALVNAAGAVVGVSTALTGGADAASYAIPINIAKPMMEQAVEGKPLSRPWMGITYTALSPDIARTHGLSIDHGAWLRASSDGSLPAVVPGGPADLAGLRDGDVLTAIDDQRIDSTHTLDDILSQYRPEDQDPIAVSILRDGAPMERQLILGMRSDGA